MDITSSSATGAYRCKGCGNSERAFLMEIQPSYLNMQIGMYEVYRCNCCGLIYVVPDPPMSDLEQIYKSDYLDLLFENPKWRKWVVPNHWLPVLLEIEKNIQEGVLLDVGCSDGLFLDFASDRGWKVFGMDVNRGKLSRAIQNHGDHAQYGSVYSMDWPDNYFDVIRLCHVFEHLADPIKALINLRQVLRPGGLLNIGVPILDDRTFYRLEQIFLPNLRKKLIKVLGWIDPPHHLTTWSIRSLQKVLETNGFELIWKSYRSDPVPWIKGFRRHCVFYRTFGVPLRILGSGATIEVLARKI